MIDWPSVRRHNLGFALLSLCAFAISERSLALLITGVSLSLASWFITAGWRKRMLADWVVWIILLMGFVAVFLRVYPDPHRFSIPSIIGILVSLGLILRMYSRHSSRDERQILMMSSILLVAAALQSSDLLVGILVLSATLMAVNCVIRYRFALSIEDRAQSNLNVTGSFLRTSASKRHMILREVQWTIRKALLIIIFLTVLIFLILPRNPQPISSFFGVAGDTHLKFQPSISLMAPKRLTPSEIELLSIEWLGPDGKRPANIETLRLRGAVLDGYESQSEQWLSRKTITRRIIIPEGDLFQSFSGVPIDEKFNTFTMRVEFRGLHSEQLLSPWVPISIRSTTSQVFSFTPRTLSIRKIETEVTEGMNKYELRVQPFATESALASLQGNSFKLPPLATFPVQSIQDTAKKLLSTVDADSSLAKSDPTARWARNIRIARIFERELTSERFRYTLDLRSFIRSGDRDPIDLFLNEYRFGHCEFFASGLCALCQSVGVDARIVVGFLASEFDKSSQRYIVRESDGHAWVEIRTGQYQWTMIDPTPVGDINPSPPEEESWAVVMRFLFAPLESLWRDEIAEFDARSQNALLQQTNDWFGNIIRPSWSAIERTARSAGESSRFVSTSKIWFGSVVLTITVSSAAAFIAFRKWQRTQRVLGLTRRGRIRTKVALRDCAFYVDALDLLEQRGIHRPPNLLPSSFAEVVRVHHPSGGNVFTEIVKRFYAIRFGGERPDPKRRAQDLALVGQMRHALTVAR